MVYASFYLTKSYSDILEIATEGHMADVTVDSSPTLSKVASFARSKNCGSRQGRVRQLSLRASLGSVADPDHKRVSWSLYKCEVPPMCIAGATGD